MKKVYYVLIVLGLTSAIANAQEEITQSVAWEKDTLITMLNLPDIMIKGERPVVKVSDGKLTYDLPRLLENKVVSNAYESILQLPGVREQDGRIVLAGANSLTVVLNGKPTTMGAEQLYELLRNTPQSRLQTAEVMYSAPPQYHTRGAVINLVLTKGNSLIPDLQGQANASYTQKHYAGYSFGATLLYSSEKFTADLLYSLNEAKGKTGLDIYSKHALKDSVYSINQTDRGNRKSLAHNIRLGMSYNLNKADEISLAYTTRIEPKLDRIEVSNGDFANSRTTRKMIDPEQMHNVGIQYKSGKSTSIGADYTFYKDNTIQDYTNFTERDFLAYTKQKIDRLTAYVDQSHTLDSWTINYGGKFSYASDHSSQFYESRSSEDLSGLDTDNTLEEYAYNLYAGFNKSFSEKLSASASLTGEYYKYGSFNEWVFFPTLEMTYMHSSSHIFQLSLSSDRAYPNYWEMHGATSYMNGYAELQGNRDLRPSKDYSAQMSYIFKGKYILTAYTNYSDDYFAQLPYQSSERLALIYKTLNWDNKLTLGINLVIPFKPVEFLNSRLTLNGFYDHAKSDHFHDIAFDNENFVFYSRLDNTVKLASNLQFELTGAYLTPNIQGPADLTKMWMVDAGLKWTFAKNNAELRLKGTDLFNAWSPDLRMNYANQNLRMDMLKDSRAITLSFSYKFGGYKSRERKNVDTSRFGQ